MADIRINALATTASSTASDDFLAVDGSANGTRKLNAYSPSFGGNATVGGTLTAGTTNTAEISNPTGQIIRQQFVAGTVGLRLESDSGNGQAVVGTTSNHPLLLRANNTTAFTLSGANATLAGNLTVSGTGTSNVGGTLVVGSTSAASGSGKLELATHTTAAGGIGFGTDTSLYRVYNGNLALDHTNGTNPVFYIRESGTGKAYLQTNNGNATLGTLTAGANLYLQSGNGTTALTLDGSTQNATFAGNVYIQSGNALRLYNPTNAAFASIQMDANNVVNVNYTTAFGVTIRTQGGTPSTPASASAAGVAGTIQWDASYIYVCTAANTWKRAAIATW